jgi:hypothetical protein
MLDPSFTRDRGLALLNLATARMGMGSVQRACATATEGAGIIRRLDSPRGRRYLAEFRAIAAPYATSAIVKEFDTKHRDLFAPTLTQTAHFGVGAPVMCLPRAGRGREASSEAMRRSGRIGRRHDVAGSGSVPSRETWW